MPLHKKKPFPLLEPPQELVPGELVYQIRFTKEILQSYQEYLNRLNLYRQRVWACKITGKTNLTYEEALVSERQAAEKVQEFPKELMATVLDIIQYSTKTLKDLVDEIYTKLNEQLLEGIELHGRKGQSIFPCKILKIVENEDSIQCEVGWLNKDKLITDTSIVNADDLIRKKAPYSRSVLKAFIRESTSQSVPWVIQEKLAKKHGISTEPPHELKDKFFANGSSYRSGRKDVTDNRKATKRKRKSYENNNITGMDMNKKEAKKEDALSKKVPIRYPIDDLLVESAADDPVFSDRPSLCTNFQVPMDCVGDLLMIWDFCSSFGRLLNLWRFSLEDFENAICHKVSNLVLVVESHAAILRLLIKDGGDYFMAVKSRNRDSKGITVITWKEFLCDFLEMEGRAKFSEHLGMIKRGHYGLLNTHAKLAILRELVSEALKTTAIRARLDECLEQQQTLAAKKREEIKRRKQDQNQNKEESNNKEVCQEGSLQNGNRNMFSSDVNNMGAHHGEVRSAGTQKVKTSKRGRVRENGESKHYIASSEEVTGNGSYSGKVKDVSATKKSLLNGRWRKKHKDKAKKLPEIEQGEHLEMEIEKLSIRTSPLGKDRNYNRYWFFRHDGRLFVESSDSKHWGYYTTKEEIDALMGSLNTKGERERALKRQLEKYYERISMALQKRSRDVLQKALVEEGELRRSSRVRIQPRENPSFLQYVNKWKD